MSDDEEFWGGCIGFIIVIVIVLLIAFKVNTYFKSVVYCVNNFTYSQIEEIKLYSGSNNIQDKGSWTILGSSVNNVDKVFYWQNDNNILTKHEVSMKDSIFIEDNKNILIVYETKCDKYPKLDNIADNRYEFHVPENSIIQLYNYK